MEFIVIVLALAVMIVAAGVKTVPQGHEWTVERFGRFQRTLKPGLNVIVPFIDRIGRRMNVQEAVIDIPSQTVITKDNSVVTVDGVVFFRVCEAEKAAYQVRDLEAAIINLAQTNIRTAIGAMDLDDTLSQREEINARLLGVLDHATQPWGTKVTRVELKDLTPPEDVVLAMSKQLSAEREKRARVLESEGFKQSGILRAEGEKQAVILAAEARLAAAERDAEARERLAEAEAKAVKMVGAVAEAGSIEALRYFIAQRYTDSLRDIAAGEASKVIVLPVESTGLAGAVAGVAELLSGAGKQGGVGAAGVSNR